MSIFRERVAGPKSESNGLRRGLTALAAPTFAVLAACSSTAYPPATQPTTFISTSIASNASSSAPTPPPQTGPLEKGWKSYGGTAYVGCPEQFASGKSALADIQPKIFDTKSGQYAAPALPALPPDENVTGAICALSGTPDDMRVVYLVTTAKQAQASPAGPTKATAFVFDLKSSQPLATKELQPPTPDLKLTEADQWRLAGTATGVAWVNAFTDGHAAQSPPRTVVLSRNDLSPAWNDPQPAKVWQDVLAFQRNTGGSGTSGAELRSPTGDPIYQDNEILTVDTELADGPDKLVKITRWDSHDPPAVSTTFYDLNSKSLIKIGDSERISGGNLVAALSDGKLFVDGHASSTSQFGYGVWNLRTHHWDLLATRDEATKSSIAKLGFFDDHLYVSKTGGTFSVLALPATDPIAPNWSARPFERISGWTLVCRGELAAALNGDCKDIVMVQDRDGRYPGPWF